MTLSTKVLKKGTLFGVLFFFSGCFSNNLTSFNGKTMGTTYSVKVALEKRLSKEQNTSLNKKIIETLKEVNRQMSTYIEDSEISKFNKSKGGERFKASSWFRSVLSFSLNVAKETGGVYDPTIGPLVNLWGFGPSKSNEKPELTTVLKTKKLVGFNKVQLYKSGEISKSFDGVYVDLSSSAKGFGVDKISELLDKEGFKNHLVEIGGELKSSGNKLGKPWAVAIEKPQEKGRSLQQIIKLNDLSIATSGNYRNFFKTGKKKYGHTINSKTGEPVQNKVLSVSVLNKSCMNADAWATAFMAMGFEKSKEFISEKGQEHAVYIIYEDASGEVNSWRSLLFKELSEKL